MNYIIVPICWWAQRLKSCCITHQLSPWKCPQSQPSASAHGTLWTWHGLHRHPSAGLSVAKKVYMVGGHEHTMYVRMYVYTQLWGAQCVSWPSPAFQGRAENVIIHKRSSLMSCLWECNSSIEDFKRRKLSGQHVQNASGKHKFNVAAKVMTAHTHTHTHTHTHHTQTLIVCMYIQYM